MDHLRHKCYNDWDETIVCGDCDITNQQFLYRFPTFALEVGGKTGLKDRFPCSEKDEDNLQNKIRVTMCSTMKKCFNYGSRGFDNSICGPSESCSFWKYNDAYLNGCIKTKYCDTHSNYQNRRTKFSCYPKKTQHWLYIEAKDYLNYNPKT